MRVLGVQLFELEKDCGALGLWCEVLQPMRCQHEPLETAGTINLQPLRQEWFVSENQLLGGPGRVRQVRVSSPATGAGLNGQRPCVWC